VTLDQLVIDDYEARFREYEDKVNTLAADLLETRSQRAHLARELEALDQRRLQEIETLRVHGLAVSQKLRAEIERLRTIIVELGAGEAAEPEEQIEALRPEDPHAN
jgi:prefoldin subunit 5